MLSIVFLPSRSLTTLDRAPRPAHNLSCGAKPETATRTRSHNELLQPHARGHTMSCCAISTTKNTPDATFATAVGHTLPPQCPPLAAHISPPHRRLATPSASTDMSRSFPATGLASNSTRQGQQAMTRARYSGAAATGLSLTCRRWRRGHGVKLCTSSRRARQLKERSRWRRAGQPERGGTRSMLTAREMTEFQWQMLQCKGGVPVVSQAKVSEMGEGGAVPQPRQLAVVEEQLAHTGHDYCCRRRF